METVTVQEVVIDKDGKPLKMHDGQYLCAVMSENGAIKTSAVPEQSLIALGFITPEEHEGTDLDNYIDEDTNEDSKITQGWTDAGTSFILDKYSAYLPLVGPMKKFNHKKKKIWERIAADLGTEKMLSKTALQVENRWKTVLKRKRNACKNNHTSGSKRQKVEFEEELAKIAPIDDSLEPEVLRIACKIIINKKDKPGASGSITEEINKTRNRRVVKLPDIFLEIHKEKEANKEKRHREKMDFLKGFARSIHDSEEKEN